MPDFVHLDDLDFGNEEANVTAKKWREAIENANRWSVTTGGFRFDGSGSNGYSLAVPNPTPGARVARVTVAITSGGSDTLGSGKAMLRKRSGLALTDDVEVTVIQPFTLASSISVGTIIVVVWEGPDWILVAAECPPPA